MKDCKFSLTYKVNGLLKTETRYQNEDFAIDANFSEGAVKLILNAKTPLELVSASLAYAYQYKEGDKFYANGYQAWTLSREYAKEDIISQMGWLASKKFAKKFAGISGDYHFKNYSKKAGIFHSHTYAYIRNNEEVALYGSLNERFGFTIFNIDMNGGAFVIEKDILGALVEKDYELFNIVKFNGGYDEVFDKYFALWNVRKPKVNFLSGYTSWYNYFTKITEKIILRDLEGLQVAEDKANIFQIDDGYQPHVGDWLDYSEDFPNGMKPIAEKIHEKGYLAGIWLAPFSVRKKSRTAKENPDWLIKDKNGKPTLGCLAWGGAYTLDMYKDGVKEHIKNFFNVVLNDWNFDMVKLDFLYSQCMEPRYGKSRGQIMVEAMEFLRECVGEKLMLGCGVPLGATFGFVDACRIGCDAHLNYNGAFYHKLNLCNEIPSAGNAILDAVFRRHLDKRAFLNDPDVFFLRDFNLVYSKAQKLLLAKINNICGSVLFVSDDAGNYGDWEKDIVKKAFTKTDAKITSAEFVSADTVKISYTENGEDKRITFSVATGENDIGEW
ncbi:MAG: alpha-galactosidase [Firmicutes bacterium]|nr:alpha-galactosidase [Bacillota bacterium]